MIPGSGAAERKDDCTGMACGGDPGLIWKPGRSVVVVQTALWQLWMDQEFVYVGDAGVVEPSGKTGRLGLDLSARYQLTRNCFADLDLNFARPRALHNSAEPYIPLAPVITSVGGLNYQMPKAYPPVKVSLHGDRPANETNEVIATGYTVFDLQCTYRKGAVTLGTQINNLFNTRWKKTQFNTLSRLQHEDQGVEEIHFTPGSPFFMRLSISVAL